MSRSESARRSEHAEEGSSGPLPLALARVYRDECSYVWNNLRRLGVHSRDLEDLVHEVFLVAHRKLAEFDTSRPIRPWLYGIAVRVASDYRSSARNRREVLEAVPPEVGPSVSRPDEELQAERTRELVLRALDRLDFKTRAAFVMHDIAGHTIAEAAAALEIPMATLYSRLRAGREQFAAAVARLQGQGEAS